MPRKKKSASAVQAQNADKLSINKGFAEQYEASKRKQILANTPAALLEDSDSSSSSSEEEDEYGELLTKGIDKRVNETLQAIRSKDPRIYDKGAKFFEDAKDTASDEDAKDEEDGDSDNEPVAGWDLIASAANAEAPKLTLKDYVRETLLKDGKLSDSESDDDGDEEEQEEEDGQESKWEEEEIVVSEGKEDSEENGQEDSNIWGDEDESDNEDFFTKKVKTKEEEEAEQKDFEQFLAKHSTKASRKAGEELLLHSYLENEKPDEKERFLRDFIMNNGWLDKNASEAPGAGDYEIEVDKTDVEEKEDEFDDKVDEFEAKYNFRFEDPDGAQVVSHARDVAGSLRRPDERRKKAREARKLKKEKEKLAKTEEIKRLKNLKKKEVEARLIAIQQAAGDGVDLNGLDLDGDFDPDKFNEQMEKKFGEEYYAQQDEQMEELDEEEGVTANEKRVEGDIPEDMREDVNKLMDEYYNLDYEDIVGGVPMRFNYKKVDAESFDMTPEDILDMEDKELNRLVSLKMLAPYRARRDVQKQAWKARRAMQKRRNEGGLHNTEQEGQKEENGWLNEKKKKKKKRGSENVGREEEEEENGEKKDVRVQNGGGHNEEEQESGAQKKRRKKRKKSDRHSETANPKVEVEVEKEEMEQERNDKEKNANRVNAATGGQGEEEDNPVSKKKRRKKRRKSEVETVESLSESRRKAYGMT